MRKVAFKAFMKNITYMQNLIIFDKTLRGGEQAVGASRARDEKNYKTLRKVLQR